MFFAMSKCAAVPEMTNVETQPIDGKMCPSLWSPLPLVWPLRYLRGHPCTRVGIGRGPEGGEHLVTFPPPPSPIPKIPNLSFFLSFGVVVASALFCEVQEFTLSGWRHSEKFWRSDLNILSSIPSPFSADRGLGALSGDPEPRQTKLQPFSPLLGLAVLNFSLQGYHHRITNLITFWRGVALIP